jgi:2-dehydropantoate 2-reductase
MTAGKFTVGGVGLGVVGTIFAVHLAEAGAELIVTDLPHRITQIENHGLRMQWGDKNLTHMVKTKPTISDLIAAKPDVIFIATKTYSLESIMPEFEKAAGADCLVMSVQNGIGTEDFIGRFVPPERVARMVVNYAGASDASWVTSVNWFNPPNYCGPLTDREDDRIARIVEMVNENGLATELVDAKEIKKKAFLKTVLNAALMPICGVLGLTMKEAMTCRIIRGYAGDLVREGLMLGGKLGYHYGDDCWDNCMDYLDKGGDHYPSMWWDLQDRRPTEIGYLNGKIVEMGQDFDDLDLSINRIFVSLVISREIKNGTREPDCIPDYLCGSA